MTGKRSGKKGRSQWRRMDIHIHTPASADYQQSGVSYLDVLQEANKKGLEIMAFTDHNTVAGSALRRRKGFTSIAACRRRCWCCPALN